MNSVVSSALPPISSKNSSVLVARCSKGFETCSAVSSGSFLKGSLLKQYLRMLLVLEIGLWGFAIYKKRVESWSTALSSICKNAFLMSANIMISGWRKRSSIPVRSAKYIGPLCKQSFNEWPLGTLTLASKTIRNFVVAWSFCKTGWCGKYDVMGLVGISGAGSTMPSWSCCSKVSVYRWAS